MFCDKTHQIIRGYLFMGETIKRKDGKNILLTISWISAFFPYLFSPIVFGPIAFFLGIVLKRDYEVGNKGNIIMVLGVVNTIVGIIFANWVVSNLGV
jgi:lipopolysaccharide export LptBFGC system permease protein LptF